MSATIGDMSDIVNIAAELAEVTEHWSPRTVARLNDYEVKVVKVRGDFVWHEHADTDELFLIVEGRVVIETEQGPAELGGGDIFVVPKGVRHRPVASEEASLLLIEPVGTPNTGSPPANLG